MTASVYILTRERVERVDDIIAQYRSIGKPIKPELAEELRSGGIRSFMKVLELETDFMGREDPDWKTYAREPNAQWPGQDILRELESYRKSQQAQIPSSLAA